MTDSGAFGRRHESPVAQADQPVKVIVFGSRTWDEPLAVKHRLFRLPPGSTIVHGDSPGGGADAFADLYGRALGHRVIPVPINEEDRRRGRMMSRPKFAPLARTVRMLNKHGDADYAIGFWDGKTPGSKFTRDECNRRGIPCEIISPTSAQAALPLPK